MRPRTIKALALACAAIFGLSACGAESEDSATPPEPTSPAATEAPTTETDPAEDAPSTEAAAEPGSRENPLAIGDTVKVGDWEVVVNEVTPDATAAIMSADASNAPPADGRQFVMIGLTATYTGEESGTAAWDLGTAVLTASGDTYGLSAALENRCGVLPEDLYDRGEQFPGATQTGNVCVSVPSDEVEGALLLISQPLHPQGDGVAVSLDEEYVGSEAAATSDETEEAADEQASAEASGEPGTRGNPLSMGETAEVGDWEVVVNEVTLDATDIVMELNLPENAPPDDRQFVLIGLTATYTGEESGTAWTELATDVVTAGGNTYGLSAGMTDHCGLIPESLSDEGEQSPGAAETGNVCVSVPSDEVDGALLMITELFSYEPARVFIALD